MKKKHTILVVGKNGRLGSSIIKRMVYSRFYRQFNVISAGRNDDLVPLVAEASVIVIAVKGDDFRAVAQNLNGRLSSKQLLISLVSGKIGKSVSTLCGTTSVVCATTSIGVEIGKGFTSWFAPCGLTPAHRRLANKVFQNWGKHEEESSDDAVLKSVFDIGVILGILAADAKINAEMSAATTKREVDRERQKVIHAMDTIVCLERAGHTFEEIIRGVVTPDGITDLTLAESCPSIEAAKAKGFKLGYEKLCSLSEA